MFNFEFILEGKNESLLPPYTGHLLRGAILTTLKDCKPAVTEELHKENLIRPFSLSPLQPHTGRFRRTKRGEIIIGPEEHYKFRMGILREDLAKELLDLTLNKEKMTIRLAKGVLQIVSINLTKTTVKELLEEEKTFEKFRLVFLTPTYLSIRKQKFPLRFPDPRYLFTNLANLWNTFQRKEAMINEEELYEWLEKNVSISGYNLRTRSAYISKGAPIIGFKGWVHYNLSEEKNGYQKWVNVLATYATYSNVGGGRTAGFGCVKYQPKR